MNLKEIAVTKGKLLLIENFIISVEPKNVEIFDTPRLVESVDGNSFKARGVLRNVNISRYTENLNKRVYPKKLWENVKSKKMGEGSLCLMGHPEDDGNPINIAGVWHNLQVGESSPTADIYMVGSHGSLMLEVVEAGGDIGFSSVGFGEIMEDGKTVDPSSYELARIGDWVLVPSQGVFANKENLIKSEEYNQSIQENLSSGMIDTNNKRHFNEINNEVIDMDKTQGNLRNQVKFEIKEAVKNSNKREALEDLKEVKASLPADAMEQHSKIDLAIWDLNKQVEAQEKALTESLETSQATIADLTESLDTTNQAYNELAERYKKLETIVEKLGVDIDSEEIVNLKEDYDKALSNIALMEKDIKQYEYNAKLVDEDVKVYEENAKTMQSDIDNLQEDRKVLESDRENLLEDRKVLEEDRELLVDFAEKALKQIRAMEKCLEEDFNAEFEKFEDEKIDSILEAAKKKEEEEPEEEKPEDEMDDEGKEDKMKEQKENPDEDEDEEGEGGEEMDEAMANEEEPEEEPEDDKEKDKKEKKESFSPVENYYESIVVESPSIEDIKDEILATKTLTEATKIVEAFLNKSKDTDVFKATVKKDELTESKKKVRPSYLGSRL